MSTVLEKRLYDARDPPIGKKVNQATNHVVPPDVAISIRNLEKTYSTSIISPKKGVIYAVADLTLDIPKRGIFVLLGSNGCVAFFTDMVRIWSSKLKGKQSGKVHYIIDSRWIIRALGRLGEV